MKIVKPIFLNIFCVCLFNQLLFSSAKIDENVISNPKARLYMDSNLTGTFLDFNPKAKINPKCLTLPKSFRGAIKSLDIFGTCVRLYDDTHCWQQSMALYPQSLSNPRQEEFLKETKSIGSCFENELLYTEVEIDGGMYKTYKKLRGTSGLHFVPDVVLFGSVGTFNDTGSLPINYYRLGHGGRVIYLRATIQFRHLNKKTEQQSTNTTSHEFYNQSEKQDGDQLGYFMTDALRPQSNLPFYNVFPQNPLNQRMMREMERIVVDKVSQTKRQAIVYLNVDYATMESRRPTGISYIIEFDHKVLRLKYLSNELPTEKILKS